MIRQSLQHHFALPKPSLPVGLAMGIERQPTQIHWNYFLALEEDLERLSRFVDFSANEKTFSLGIAHLFMAASSEVDVVLKQLARSLNANSTASSIGSYYEEIVPGIPRLIDFEAWIPRFALRLHPWTDWTRSQAPLWWRNNNKVKHHRHTHFERANLKNCLNAMGGLYSAVLYLYRNEAEEGRLLQIPRIFNVADRLFGGTSMVRTGHSFRYRLPLQ
jgi:hypothetical protein